MAVDERIKNIKIAVHNEEESRKVQEKLFELGARWRADNQISSKFIKFNYLGVADGKRFVFLGGKKDFDNHSNKEIYVEDLLAMEKQEDNYFLEIRNEIGETTGFYPSIDFIYKIVQATNKDILQRKEKILEDLDNLGGCVDDIDGMTVEDSCYKSEVEEILNKRIGN